MKKTWVSGRNIESLFWILIWALVFSVPYFQESSEGLVSWEHLFRNWLHISGFLLLFLVNVYFLTPRLLLKKKYLLFIVCLAGLIISTAVLDMALRPVMERPSGSAEKFPRGHFRKPPLIVFADFLIISLLISGAGTAVKLFLKWRNEEQRRQEAEKEQLKTSLALLKQQISPHFFLNTLNNIHAQIELNSGKAQDAVERLSTLMRYLLYETTESSIELRKEIEFIRSYFSLMQLRHSEDVEVSILIPSEIPATDIPPLLFISLIENAFKHGADYPRKSFIHFELQFQPGAFFCTIKNSKRKAATDAWGEYSGIGLENLRQSLKLLYDADFTLDIFDREDDFEVNLRIPV